MNIRLIKIDVKVLEIIIKTFGSSSIGNCIPDLELGKLGKVLFDVSLIGNYTLHTADSVVTICNNDREASFDQRDFFKLIIL